MNFKTTVGLLLVLVVVLAVSWYLGVFGPERPETTKPPVIEAKKHLLIAPKLKDVKKIRLDTRARGYLVFQKIGDDWQIVEPVKARAVNWSVTDLVSAFEDAKKLETFIPGEGEFAEVTLKDLALAEPAVKVTLEEDDRKLTFLVGKNVELTENTYVKLPEAREVAVIDVNLRTKIKKDLKEYRDKQLWELKKDKITELRYDARDGTNYKFTKSDDHWLMLSPIRAPADKETVSKALDKLVWLRAEEFIDDKPDTLEGYGLDKPAWKITVVITEKITPKETGKDKAETKPASTKPTIKRTEHTILIGDSGGLNADYVYAKLPEHEWVVAIKQEDLKEFTPDAIAWREKKIIDVAKGQINKLEIDHKDSKFTLVKKTGTWRLELKPGKLVKVETSAVDDLLTKIADMKAASFKDKPTKTLAKEGLDKPTCQVKIFAADKVEPIELAIGKTTPSGLYRYVRRSGRAYLAAVAEENVAQLYKPARNYRNRKMIDFSIDDVVAIELKRTKRTYKLTRADKGKRWQVIKPIKADADQDKVKDLILACSTLKAESFPPEADLRKYDLDKPEIDLTITTQTEVEVVKARPTTTAASGPATTKASTKPVKKKIKRQYKLCVSKHGGKVYAVAPTTDPQLVGEVAESLHDDLSAELIKRDIFGDLPTDKIEKLVIRRKSGKKYVFAKKDDKWQYPADPVVVIDKEKIDDLTKALAELKANRYVSFEAKDAKRFGLDQPYLKITAGGDGKDYVLTIGRPATNGRYAQASGKDGWIFEITSGDVDKFDKHLKDFAKK